MRAQDVTVMRLLEFELDHRECPWCGRPTCLLASCRCSFPRWAAHRFVCGAELGVAG